MAANEFPDGILQLEEGKQVSFNWNMQECKNLEAKETIEPKLLDDIAKVLSVSVDANKNFTEDAGINFIAL